MRTKPTRQRSLWWGVAIIAWAAFIISVSHGPAWQWGVFAVMVAMFGYLVWQRYRS